MSYFLGVCIFIFCVCSFANVSHIADEDYPKKSRNSCVWDAFLNFFLAVWALVLFFS